MCTISTFIINEIVHGSVNHQSLTTPQFKVPWFQILMTKHILPAFNVQELIHFLVTGVSNFYISFYV